MLFRKKLVTIIGFFVLLLSSCVHGSPAWCKKLSTKIQKLEIENNNSTECHGWHIGFFMKTSCSPVDYSRKIEKLQNTYDTKCN